MFHKPFKCLIGLHDWRFRTLYEPNINAKIITRAVYYKKCFLCGDITILEDIHFDPVTGEPIEEDKG